MAANSVNSPFPIITDIDGQPLEGGYIWIGTAGLDPQTNPQNAYWDTTLIALATQPVRTIGGYPIRTGTPARLYVNGDFSIRIMNKNGTIIYSSLYNTNRITSDQVGFTGPDGLSYLVSDLANSSSLLKGDALLAVKQPYGGSIARTQHDKNNELITPGDFGADILGTIDATSFLQLLLDATLNPTIQGTFLVSNTLTLRSNQNITFKNCVIQLAPGVNKSIFLADNISKWSMSGHCRLVGTLATSLDVGAEVGLEIIDCNDYMVSDLTFYTMRQTGIIIKNNVGTGTFRGDQGKFNNIALYYNRTGLKTEPGSGAEYNVFTNLNAVGNITGLDIAAGNIIVAGGNIVDNTYGVTLNNGANHGHGIFSGVNINHNSGWNLKAISVIYGMTFVGCHFYGNSALDSFIWFVDSKHINIHSGHIDCPIYNDGTTGKNSISYNCFPGTYISINGTNIENLILTKNYTGVGSSIFNDPSITFLYALRSVTDQALTIPAILIFNNELKDNRKAYDPVTGIFTAPIAGYYNIIANILISGTGISGTGYAELYVNAGVVVFVPIITVSATVATSNINATILLAAGDAVKISATSITATNPLLSKVLSSLSITQLS